MTDIDIAGRWVVIAYDDEGIEQRDRLILDGCDPEARRFEWEWVPYESDQIPVRHGTSVYVGWRMA